MILVLGFGSSHVQGELTRHTGMCSAGVRHQEEAEKGHACWSGDFMPTKA